MIKLYSVPHTGTKFIAAMLKRHGIEVEQAHYGSGVVHGGLIISPIRDPWMCYITHESRGRPGYFNAWEDFNHVYQNSDDIHIIPIDTKSRNRYLKKLSERLGVELETTWQPVGAGERSKIEKADLGRVYDLPVVKQFYKKPNYRVDYIESMNVVNDPVIKRIQLGVDHQTIKEVFGLTDKQFEQKLKQAY